MTDVGWWRAFDQRATGKIVEKKGRENSVAMDTGRKKRM